MVKPSARGHDEEQEVAALVTRGMGNRETAQDLRISARTVQVHLPRITSRNAPSERVRRPS